MGKSTIFEEINHRKIKPKAALPWKSTTCEMMEMDVLMWKNHGTEDGLFYWVELITAHEFTW